MEAVAVQSSRIAGAGAAQPAEADGEHAAIKPMVGLLKPCVRHVEVMVLKHHCPLRPEKILKSYPTLRKKLRVACDFRRILVYGGVNRPGARIEIGHEPAHWFESETHHQGRPDQASARMRRTAQHLLADQLKALQRKPRVWRIPGNDSNLWRGKNKIDVRNIVGDVILEANPELNAKCEPPMAGPVWFGCALGELLGRRWC